MNWNLVGSIYGRSSLKSAHFVMLHYTKLTETWQEASIECPLWRLLISSRSVDKHGQFLFLIGWYLKNLLWNCLAKWTETWYEASTCMEGSVLSFLKAEWKVSDTGSAHWTSSSITKWYYQHPGTDWYWK